jgi:hypothetical protein
MFCGNIFLTPEPDDSHIYLVKTCGICERGGENAKKKTQAWEANVISKENIGNV